jgi:hypothetical protein
VPDPERPFGQGGQEKILHGRRFAVTGGSFDKQAASRQRPGQPFPQPGGKIRRIRVHVLFPSRHILSAPFEEDGL